MTKLSKQQTNQQDFVDNEIFELLQNFLPPLKKIDWDIEIIGAIRDVIQEQLVCKKIISEKQFYP